MPVHATKKVGFTTSTVGKGMEAEPECSNILGCSASHGPPSKASDTNMAGPVVEAFKGMAPSASLQSIL